MSGLTARLRDVLGFDHGGARYTYVSDPGAGPVSAGRSAERWVRTTCGYCSVGCGMLVGVRGGRAVAVQGDPAHPVNRGRLCPKGLSEHQMLAAPGRLTTPTIDGRAASWDEALARVTGGFRALLDEHGPESVAVLSTGQLVTEEFYALGKLVRLGMGLAHFDGNTTLCMASAVAGYKASFGSDGPPGCYEDLEQADVLVLWGANIADNHPLLAPRVLHAERSQQLIVVDPRVTKTAMVADTHLAVRPRGDIALLNGILRVLFDEDLIDPADAGAVEGVDDLRAHLGEWSVDRAAAESGIDAGTIAAVARTIAAAERCTIAWTMGVNHSVQGTATVTLINTLALLTGNVGRPGASPFSITGQCNAMGTREAGFTASMPGYRSYDDPAARVELADMWGVDADRLPTARGRAYPDIVNGVMSGRIKGLWIIATNPVVSFPNREVLEVALANLDLLVVQDGFETPTSALADIVLPAAVWGEKDGTFTNSERRVSRVRRVVDPPGSARTDFDIVIALADRWGCADELFPGWTGPEDAFEEWRRVSAGRPSDYSGMTWARIEAAGGLQWPCPDEGGDGTARLYADGTFRHADGRARVFAVEPEPVRDAPNPAYPFLLNTGRTVEHWHTRTKTGRIPVLENLSPEAWVEIHPRDAEALGIRGGDWVRVSSTRGTVERIGPGPRRSSGPARSSSLPLGGPVRQPPHRRPVRPGEPGAQLQAVRRPHRGRLRTPPTTQYDLTISQKRHGGRSPWACSTARSPSSPVPVTGSDGATPWSWPGTAPRGGERPGRLGGGRGPRSRRRPHRRHHREAGRGSRRQLRGRGRATTVPSAWCSRRSTPGAGSTSSSTTPASCATPPSGTWPSLTSPPSCGCT